MTNTNINSIKWLTETSACHSTTPHLHDGKQVAEHYLQVCSRWSRQTGVVAGVSFRATVTDSQFAIVGDVGSAAFPQWTIVLQPLDSILTHPTHGAAGHD